MAEPGKLPLTGDEREIFKANETEANRFACNFLLLSTIWSAMIVSLIWSDVFSTDKHFATVIFTVEILFRIILYIICWALKFRGAWQKYVLLFSTLVGALFIVVLNVNSVWLYFSVPAILSCRYYDEQFTRLISTFCIILLIVALPISAWFDMRYHYIDLNLVKIPEGAVLTMEGDISKTILESGYFNFWDYCTGDARTYAMNIMFIIMVTYISIIVADHGREMILSQIQTAQEKARAEVELVNSNARVMISQIQPHFLYNSLTAIMGVEGNPPETKQAIADFSRYLRGNMDALKSTECIPFEQELEHIGYYLHLEKLRFGDRLRVEMDLEATWFDLPALSVQMLLENAVKHGVMARSAGGTVSLSSREEEDSFTVTVRDDGVGFDPEFLPDDGRSHVGLTSVKERLAQMCGGSLSIESRPGSGTTAVITIPKGDLSDEDFSG